MKLKDLTIPFPEEDIEWRIAQAGKKGNGQVWAKCLAYVQARAIMNRLDDVCGPENWKATYRFIQSTQGIDPGVICELSIKIAGEWVTKEDGAEQTDIESFKGGISSALKRAAVAWGIGRYLYNLEEGFAQIVDSGKGAKYARTKIKEKGVETTLEFYWLPPNLPAWALPDPTKAKSNGVHPQQPGPRDGNGTDAGYRIPFGKYAKRSLEEVDLNELRGYVLYIENKAHADGKPLTGQVKDFIDRASEYITAIENGTAVAS